MKHVRHLATIDVLINSFCSKFYIRVFTEYSMNRYIDDIIIKKLQELRNLFDCQKKMENWNRDIKLSLFSGFNQFIYFKKSFYI